MKIVTETDGNEAAANKVNWIIMSDEGDDENDSRNDTGCGYIILHEEMSPYLKGKPLIRRPCPGAQG